MKNLLSGACRTLTKKGFKMTIQELAEQIINSAENVDGFYEVELSILIRTDGGKRSNFVRLHSDIQTSELDSEKDQENKWF